MATGAAGTFLISWTQAELDGLVGTNPRAIAVGSTWRWCGTAVRVDDPRDILILRNSDGQLDTHQRAAHKIRRFLGAPELLIGKFDAADPDQSMFRYGFEITDGQRKFQVTLIDVENGCHPMLLFVGNMPPVDEDLWVVSCTMPAIVSPLTPDIGGTVCFTPATLITTPDGQKLVQDLCEDDLICTKDNGAQPIRWIGSRQITGGRLMAMPTLRPIRIKANVFADGEPDRDLVVSPDHRILVKGHVARALFNTSEVLVAARDLVNDAYIRVDHNCRGITYIHLMLDQHQIVWANGVEVESFHPAAMDPHNIDPSQRKGLWQRFPDVLDDVHSYGEYARRNLTRSEAAILSYGALGGH